MHTFLYFAKNKNMKKETLKKSLISDKRFLRLINHLCVELSFEKELCTEIV